ncbi:circumsporozoite protein-like [Scylla paramamosain]|uniref:circumsporozoite protein-like n=1 Tax=Scylla paramamosain TaxID=85552 RepID=UPI003082ABA3
MDRRQSPMKSCRWRRDEASGRAPGNSRKLEGPAEVTWRSVRDWERLLASGEGQLESAAGGERREGGRAAGGGIRAAGGGGRRGGGRAASRRRSGRGPGSAAGGGDTGEGAAAGRFARSRPRRLRQVVGG